MKSRKFNLKLYLALNLFFILIVGFRSFGEQSRVFGLLVIFIGVTLNQIFLVRGVSLVIISSLQSDPILAKKSRNKGTIYLALKIIILVLAFTISVQFNKDTIKMALIFYLLTFISLYISLSKGLKHDE
jgi:hypothetical protein